jgi:thioesterase domain-containing protein
MNRSEPSPMSNWQLETYLHEHIPLTQSMELSVQQSNLDSVELAAPLEPNVNHRNTVFGGSIAALAMLAGWGLSYMHLRNWPDPIQIVIQRNELEFEEPVEGPFTARCESPGEPDWPETRARMDRWDKARVHLDVNLTVDEKHVGEFQGAYVVLVQT